MNATVGLIALLVVLLGCFPAPLLHWIDGALQWMPR